MDSSLQRRFVVALNLSRTEVWKRIYEDYHARQVLFVVENAEGLTREHYRSAAKVLSATNGDIVFLLSRDRGAEMDRESDLAWIREIWAQEGIVVIKLPAKILMNLLGKLRNPQKHDIVERQINGILDIYSRNYLKHIRKPRKSEKAEDEAKPGRYEPAQIDIPSSECYGELDMDKDGQLSLMVFKLREGPGKRPQVCPPIKLGDQAFNILQAGIETARRRYIMEKEETAEGNGIPTSPSECEPPAEFTYEVSWDQDDLAKALHSKQQFSGLNRKQKSSVKTAVSRLRNLVSFSDGQGLVSDSDSTNTRHATIRFRYRKSGVTP